jgi:dipeptidyl aminopeptidase/acylaminoacyl peptidase
MGQPFEPADLLRYHTIGSIHCTPGVDAAACTVRSPDADGDTYRSSVWLVPLDGRSPFQFTSGTSNDSDPQWSPDGSRLAFVSSRGGSVPQLHVIRREGGEARQVSRLKNGVVSFAWGPDGTRFLATALIPVDSSAKGERNSTARDEGPQVVWRLPYKSDGLGFLLNREIHLFTVDADEGTATQVTDGPFDVRSACWAPDGGRITFTRTRAGRQAHRTDVWIMNADGSNARQVTDAVAAAQYPKWSPDGRWIAFTGGEHEGDSQQRLWVIDTRTDAVTPLGDEALEVHDGLTVQWLPDSSAVVFVRIDRGLQHVARIGVPDGRIDTLVDGRQHVLQLAVGANHLVYSAASISDAEEVAACDWTGAHCRRLTDFNAWWQEKAVPKVELRQFDVPDGRGGTESVDGWLLLPTTEGGGPHPLLVDVHGGPQSVAFLEFHKHVYRHVLCSQGWAVLALNPVGSSSYGPEFSRRLRGKWGKLDLDQHLAAVEHLRRQRIADDRVAIGGKSYGGYLSAWAVTQTDIFKAAVVSAPVANIESHYGTSDTGYYVTPYAMCGEPAIDRRVGHDLCPLEHMDQATTPVLLLQGTEDHRCPVGQSEEIFATLMRSGDSPVEMILYPGGSHHLAETGKPSFRVDYVTRWVEWVSRWANRASDDRTTDEQQQTQSSSSGSPGR